MSYSQPLVKLTLTAGQVWDMPVTFKNSAGAAINLTGSTVYFTAKADLEDEDEDAVIDSEQDTHTSASTGVTALPIDLSGLPEMYFTHGGRLIGSLWIEDAAENRIPYGTVMVEILPSAKWKP